MILLAAHCSIIWQMNHIMSMTYVLIIKLQDTLEGYLRIVVISDLTTDLLLLKPLNILHHILIFIKLLTSLVAAILSIRNNVQWKRDILLERTITLLKILKIEIFQTGSLMCVLYPLFELIIVKIFVKNFFEFTIHEILYWWKIFRVQLWRWFICYF